MDKKLVSPFHFFLIVVLNVFMMNESVANGAPDNEQTRGMITSLWFMSENIAGYLGRYEMFIILYIYLFLQNVES